MDWFSLILAILLGVLTNVCLTGALDGMLLLLLLFDVVATVAVDMDLGLNLVSFLFVNSIFMVLGKVDFVR